MATRIDQVQDLSSSTDSLFNITSPTLSVSSLSSSGFDFIQTPRTRTRNTVTTIEDSDDEIVWNVSENEDVDLDVEYERLSASTGGLLSDDDFVVLSRGPVPAPAPTPLSLVETQTQTQIIRPTSTSTTFDANTPTKTTNGTVATTNTNITADSTGTDTGTIRKKRFIGFNTDSVSLAGIIAGPTLSSQSQEHVDHVNTNIDTPNGTKPLILDGFSVNVGSKVEKNNFGPTELVNGLARLSLDIGNLGNAYAVEMGVSGMKTPVKKESSVESVVGTTRKERRKEKRERKNKEGDHALVPGEEDQAIVKEKRKRKKEKTVLAEDEERIDPEKKERKKAKIEIETPAENGGSDNVVAKAKKEKKKKGKGKGKDQKEKDIATFSALEAAVLSAPTMKSTPALSKSISTATLVPSSDFGISTTAISASYPELELVATTKSDEQPIVFSLTPKVRPLTIPPSELPPLSQDVDIGNTTTTSISKRKAKRERKEKKRSILNSNNNIISPGNNTNTIIAEKVSEQTPSHYDEAVNYITSYISNPAAHQDQRHQLTLFQSLIIELGLIQNLDQLPLTIKSSKKFLKSHAFLNIKEYILRRLQGPEVVRGLLYPSRWALIKDMRKGKGKGEKCPLSWVKKKGLQVLLVSVFH